MITAEEAFEIASKKIATNHRITGMAESEKFYLFSRRQKNGKPVIDSCLLFVNKCNGEARFEGLVPDNKWFKIMRSSKGINIEKFGK